MADDPETLHLAEGWNDTHTTEAPLHLLLPARQVRPPALRQLTGPGAPRHFALEAEETIVGRSEDAHLSIDAPDMSRQHATLIRLGHEVRLVDLDSRNGIYLNGIRVHAAVLCPGDTLHIGSVTFVFSEG